MLIKAGEIIKNSWEIYAKNWRRLFPYMLMIFLPNFILGPVGFASIYLDKFAPRGFFMYLNNLIVFAVFVASLIFTLWAAAAMAKNLKTLAEGQPDLKWRDALGNTSRFIWPIIYTSLLVMLIILGGTILLIIPGIIFSVWYVFAYYAVIFEEKKGYEALKTSKALVTGRWWGTLWRLIAPGIFYGFLAAILSYAVATGLSLIFQASMLFAVVNGFCTSVISSLVAPLSALAIILLYLSAKKEPAIITPTNAPVNQ